MSGMIFDIQRYSSHDGPGIRTTVFFKGCGLRCRWCHNPESLSAAPSVMYTPGDCMGCTLCAQVCPAGAHHFPEGEGHIYDRSVCTGCGKCTEVCPTGALELSGKQREVTEIMEVIERDRSFYESSGGGVTLSGGEVLLQADTAVELLKECKKSGLHTAVDTAGFVSREALEKVTPYADLFLYDIKAVTPELHRKATGQDNALILENYSWLAAQGARIWVRIPVIPGYSASTEEIAGIGDFLKGDGTASREPECVELLKYHRMAESKYASLGMDYTMGDTVPPSDEEMETYRKILAGKLNCEVRVG